MTYSPLASDNATKLVRRALEVAAREAVQDATPEQIAALVLRWKDAARAELAKDRKRTGEQA